MPIPSTIGDLSTTPSLNSPAGSDNVSTTDDYLRAIQAIVKTQDNATAKLDGATFTGYINEARGTVAMHATTMDLWAQPNIIDGSGSAVTITAIANAPQAGASRTVYVPVGTVITDGATFAVDGNASYTAKAGDGFVFEAVTTSTYKVHIITADGGIVATTSAVTVAADDKVLIKDTSNGDKLETVTAQSIADLAGFTLATKVTPGAVTSVDFTGIPAGVKIIAIELVGISTNGTGNVFVTLSDAGGFETSGYLGSAWSTSAGSGVNDTTSFPVTASISATSVIHGIIFLTLVDASTFTWAESGNVGFSNAASVNVSAGSKSLSAELTGVRVTLGGGNTFDAGSINILYK